MKTFQTLLLMLLFTSCKPQQQQCEFTSDNEELMIYNNILTDLIENRMQGKYLGGKEEEIREEYYYGKNDIDTARIDLEFTKAHNDILNTPSEFCVLYLDTAKRQRYAYDSLGSIPDLELRRLINEYTTNDRAAIESLNESPNYSPSDYGLCTARLEYLRTPELDTTNCSFGRLRLSKIILNDKRDKGLLYYKWTCGNLGLCGHGGLIRIRKITEKWQIEGFEYWVVY